jgi:RNA polymerase sigma-70 factor (ECF subfamily)
MIQSIVATQVGNLDAVDLGLVERARRGDAAAFDALVERRVGQTFRLASAILGDPHEAEDATQEAFLSAWRNLPRLRDAERFDAWFGRIVVNACRMSLRQRSRVVVLSVEATDPTPDPAAEHAFAGVAGSDALQRAIERLTVDQRSILALHHVEERSVAEIAAILGVPVGTAKWRLHDARRALERAMEAER